MLKVDLILALKDNYIYVLQNQEGKLAVIDPSTVEDVNKYLENKHNPTLDFILNTHHHWDHTAGNSKLKSRWGATVMGYKEDAHRIPSIDVQLSDNQTWEELGSKCLVLSIPGHTLGHIAYYFEKEKYLFCGDTLFGMGCGRLFEGTPSQMLDSLKKISKLPKSTKIYCGHEYTENNLAFSLEIEGKNPALHKRKKEILNLRKQNKPTIPFTLEEELKTNPFLRVKRWIKEDFKTLTHKHLLEFVRKNPNISELSLFTELRKMKDRY